MSKFSSLLSREFNKQKAIYRFPETTCQENPPLKMKVDLKGKVEPKFSPSLHIVGKFKGIVVGSTIIANLH